MSADPTTVIAALGLEPTYSAREAAAMLGRSYSWLDQRLRAGQFVLPDGATVRPLRTAGGYRRFTLAMLEGIAACSYRCGWYSMDELKFAIGELLSSRPPIARPVRRPAAAGCSHGVQPPVPAVKIRHGCSVFAVNGKRQRDDAEPVTQPVGHVRAFFTPLLAWHTVAAAQPRSSSR
jgi:hypothetical protein